MRHDPTVLPEIRERLREARTQGRDIRCIQLSTAHFGAFVLATKPSARSQLEGFLRGEEEAPVVYHRKIRVMPLSVPDDEAVVLMEVKPHSIPIDNDEAPIV